MLQQGFTLIELLVVVSIISLLIALLLPTLGAAHNAARSAQALAAMQQTLVAYTNRAVDYKGELLPGYLPAGTYRGRAVTAKLPTGVIVRGLPAQRYPVRLAEYQGDAWQMIYHHTSAPQVPGPDDPDLFGKAYALGVNPSLGINAIFVGGDYRIGGAFRLQDSTYQPDLHGSAVFSFDRVRRPSSLIAFAETQQTNGLSEPDGTGFHVVSPPRHVAKVWTGSATGIELATPGGTIGVPLGRFSDAAATGMIDGHARAQPPADLNDMRRWSNNATHEDFQIP